MKPAATPTPRTTWLHRFVAEALAKAGNGDLDSWLIEQRAARNSWGQMSVDLAIASGHTVSPPTIRSWHDAAIEASR